VFNFFSNIEKFAFYDELREILENDGIDIESALKDRKYDKILDGLISENGMDYGNLPKGLLKFHSYENFCRTALGEHMVEGANYCTGNNKQVHLHFTVSPEHMNRFKKLVGDVKTYYENKYNVNFKVDFSIQKPATDTIAVDMDNNPFRNADNSILFRPGGHGALIENLNDIDADIVFIKNIDNVVPDSIKDETYRYKMAIGGLLIDIQEKIFQHLNKLQQKDHDINLTVDFYTNELGLSVPDGFNDLSKDEQIDFLFTHLNRPIRVCGMVKNEGEPGGGPFRVKNADDEVSLQIVESSQIDMKNEEQTKIVNNATHFNPVDLVCGIKNFHGESFDLNKYVDPATGFIAIKSKDGKQLKAQELPGLWNGAMADWITLFVEVPIVTFNPVKTINDLLRETHQ